MNNDPLKTFLEARIAEVKKESTFHLRAMEGWRLWPNWAAFLDDYDMWVNRAGHWSNILIKEKTD